MSENIEKLRRAIGRVHADCDCNWCSAVRDADAALAAVEQELAALRLSYENVSRAHFEATKRIDALTECQAKLKAELDEEVDHNARLSAKLDETKHNCACDYDERGAVCLVHARPVREARERIAALEKDRDHCRRLYLEACEMGSGHARIAALEAERDELRKDADRWRELRGQSGLSVNEDGQVDLFALVADSTEAEDAPWLTDIERRALDGELGTEPLDGIRNGWVWKADTLDRAVDALIDAEKAASPEADPATAAGEG